ncbi:MAG: hypothetical protein KIT33_08040 [Candidatus Kapabacteria bacterium]|nr:hypothetical protein [Ignavibacteriota bacterium]MCW5884904.1 hypothetical protein [Candidatus Kapabacteria bacterium]
MKKIAVILIALFTLNISFSLQDDRLDEFSFESSELKHESTPYFAIAGGVTFTFNFANFEEINNQLKKIGFGVGDFSGQVSLWGGEGFTGIVYVPNMRVGFFSYGGSSFISKDFPAGDEPGFNREVEYQVGLSGLSIEYAYVPLKSFAIVGGLSLGRGDLTISSYDTRSESNWENFSPEPGLNNSLNMASSNFWVIKPNLYFEYALTNFLMFRAGASYNYTLGYDWKQNYNANLQGVPDGLNANALQLQAGIFLGLFNY